MGDNMFKGKKKFKNIKTVFIIGIAICLIGLSVFVVNIDRKTLVFESLIKDGYLFLGNLVNAPINFISNKIDEFNEQKRLYEDNLKLKNKVEQYDLLYAEKETLKKEIEELKRTLEINNLLSEKLVMNAVVVNRNIDYWREEITIDKGLKDGIVEGMPVITSQGLIGKIISVSNFNSVVRLLTSLNIMKTSVKIQSGEEYIYGLMNGYNYKNNTYQIEGISRTDKLEIGDIVTTTGMGDIFPDGILVGTVVGVKADSYDLSVVVEVAPSVDFDNFTVVTVLKRNVDL
ncbi:MAG: rod shape-determining protein MreC [Firmicutes bacterium]|nr:rod shape-determining protein MreC [Bacillota bacterium]